MTWHSSVKTVVMHLLASYARTTTKLPLLKFGGNIIKCKGRVVYYLLFSDFLTNQVKELALWKCGTP